jgi:hypothetical protein
MPREMRQALGKIAFNMDVSTGKLMRDLAQQAIREAIEKGTLALMGAAVISGALNIDDDLRRSRGRFRFRQQVRWGQRA